MLPKGLNVIRFLLLWRMQQPAKLSTWGSRSQLVFTAASGKKSEVR
jgi:hypothetical protein